MAENSIEAICREWETHHLVTKSDSHRTRVMARFEKYVFPYIGRRPVAEVTSADILDVARRVEKLGKIETAHRVVQTLGQAIRYAIATGRAENDPTSALRGALKRVSKVHMPAPADQPVKVGEYLRAFEVFSGTPEVAAAVRLLPLVFVRPGELRVMRWEDVDLAAAEWRYTASKTGQFGV